LTVGLLTYLESVAMLSSRNWDSSHRCNVVQLNT